MTTGPVPFIGRRREVDVLTDALSSREAELIAVIGRRRVGKTFLVNRVYGDRIAFSVTGLQNAPKREQLQNFAYQLAAYSGDKRSARQPSNWLEAFQFLRLQLSQQLGD